MGVSSSTRKLGPYVLGPKIGAGGMAAVFAARHESGAGAARIVALKVMSTSLASDGPARDMFLREAKVAVRLEHPNVVRVYDSGEVEGELYLAMELVEGASLARLERSAKDPVPIPIALRIATDVARGLHAAHELCDLNGEPFGVIHQDVTPQNILVGYDGVTKLLDFGIARVLRHDLSRTDNVRGKPGYLAPEQVLLGKLDRRVDVFALGVVLHELLSGERLFTGDHLAMVHERVLHAPIPRVDTLRPEIPKSLADAVERALSRNPNERFESADALRIALRETGKLADDDEIAAWVRATAPAEWSRRSLERELFGGAPALADVSDLETVAPRATPASRNEASVDLSTAAPISSAPKQLHSAWYRTSQSYAVLIILAFAAVATLLLIVTKRTDSPPPSVADGADQPPKAVSSTPNLAPLPTTNPADPKLTPPPIASSIASGSASSNATPTPPPSRVPAKRGTTTRAPSPKPPASNSPASRTEQDDPFAHQ